MWNWENRLYDLSQCKTFLIACLLDEPREYPKYIV